MSRTSRSFPRRWGGRDDPARQVADPVDRFVRRGLVFLVVACLALAVLVWARMIWNDYTLHAGAGTTRPGPAVSDAAPAAPDGRGDPGRSPLRSHGLEDRPGGAPPIPPEQDPR